MTYWSVSIAVTTAATNSVTLVDIGTSADPDGFFRWKSDSAINSTGTLKGFFPCNGALVECQEELQLQQPKLADYSSSCCKWSSCSYLAEQ